MRIYLVIILATGMAAAGCSRTKQVTINNLSGVAIGNVWVSGPHFAEDLGTIAPNETVKISCSPQGSYDAWLTFEENGITINSNNDSYFELNTANPLVLTIDPTFNMSFSGGMKKR
jgi:hypothetical protein